MREIYTSPRQQNIDNVVALMAEHGIETTVSNRSNYNRPTWQRFSYSQKRDDRTSWPQVWVTRADDYARARVLLREIGIEPLIRHAEELAIARDPSLRNRRGSTPTRVRRILIIAVVAVFALQMLRFMHII